MRASSAATLPAQRSVVPLLSNGDRMTQPEFHRRYLAYPDDTKFELVGGIVYMASPLKYPHSAYHVKLSYALETYALETPGIEVTDNATSILGEESEPQPDLGLRILEDHGGQSRINADGYIEGPPELLIEIADSSRSIDLHQKRDDYENAGVLEYLVLSVEDERIFWFHFPSGRELISRKGVFRSVVFPGLWIHEQAMIQRNSRHILATLKEGLATRGHASFVRRLERQRQKRD